MLIPVILCGGAGSRLWPVSREAHPKPFIRLGNGKSLLQNSWLRGADLAGVTEILTVTNQALFFKTESEYREVVGSEHSELLNSFILEPFGRNTAPAAAAAALQIAAAHGEDALMLVLPADHLIADQAAFATAVTQAILLAKQGKLVTFGIAPDQPETAFGYIEARGTKVLRFVEKPPLETAKQYIASGSYLWNSGMFCFTAGALLREMTLHCPELLNATRACLASARRSENGNTKKIELTGQSFSLVPDDSIDYAVMEKSENIAVVRCDIGWSDIGSWRALGDLVKADASGNRIEGNVVTHDVTNCYIQSNDRMTGVVGLDNIIIIDTPDALLVANRDRSQDVKRIYSQLKIQGHDTYQLHRTVHRPWGTYTVLEEGPRFKIKRIVVIPGGRLSLQMHHHRSEHWIVVSGMALVVNGDKELYINSNESTFIPAGHKHRLENPGVVELVMIEVQSGDYLGEDDIVRFEDVYGRA